MARALALSLALVLWGCSPIVDAEFTDIEVIRPDIQIPAAPAALRSSVTFSFIVQSSALGASTKPDVQDRILSAELRGLALEAKDGIADLSFIQSMHALACVPLTTNSLKSSRQVEIADYVRQGEAAPSPRFEVPIPDPVDLLPLLRPSKTEPRRILVIVDLGGTLPTTEWHADVTLSLAVHIHQ
jgi:hypothetical protein